MRKEEKGFPAKVKVGYGSRAATRGLHPRGLIDRLVHREAELDGLDPKLHIVRVSARVGERKRLGIISKAKERNFHIANPGKEESRPITEPTVEKQPSLPAETETTTRTADEESPAEENVETASEAEESAESDTE